MSHQTILNTLTRILRDLLLDETITLSMTTTRAEIPDWDSFAYVNFMVAVEMEFGIRFSVAEVESFENVGQIVSRTAELADA